MNPSETPEEQTPTQAPQPIEVTTASPETPVTTAVEAPITEPQAPPALPSPAPIEPKKSHRGLILAGLFGLVVVVGAAVALVALNKPDKVVVATKKDIPLLRIGSIEPMSQAIYPDDVSYSGDIEFNQQVFEGLTKTVAHTHIMPDLADSWTNPDSTHWVFKLHHGVYFHDGNLMTSKQVKASIMAMESTDYFANLSISIADITTPDDYTVNIHTETPDALLANKLTLLYIYDTDSKTPHTLATGTGPYDLKPGTALTNTKVSLVAYDKYFGGKPSVRELQYNSFENFAGVTEAYKAKQIDVATIDSQSTADQFKSDSLITPLKAYSVYDLTLNTKHGGPLAKLAVRQALAEGIDRSALAKSRKDSGAPIAQPIPAEVPGSDPAITVPVPNPTKAKADLATAGYPNGFKMSFLYYNTNQSLAEELQKQLAAIGVSVTLDPETDGAILHQKVSEGSVDAFFNSTGSGYFDGSDVLGNHLPPAFYTNDAVSALLTKAAGTFDAGKRLKVLQQAEDAFVSDVGTISFFQAQEGHIVTHPNLVFKIDTSVGTTGVFYWQVYGK